MKVLTTSISNGPRGTYQTLILMMALARQTFQSEIVQRTAHRLQDVADLDRYMRSIFTYAEEPYEIILSPIRALSHVWDVGYFEGDCDDAATLAASIGKAMGGITRIIAIQTKANDKNFYHVFAEIDGKVVDPTVAYGTVYNEFGRMSVYV